MHAQGESHVKLTVMPSQPEALPEAGGGLGHSLPWVLQREPGPTDTSILDFWPPGL